MRRRTDIRPIPIGVGGIPGRHGGDGAGPRRGGEGAIGGPGSIAADFRGGGRRPGGGLGGERGPGRGAKKSVARAARLRPLDAGLADLSRRLTQVAPIIAAPVLEAPRPIRADFKAQPQRPAGTLAANAFRMKFAWIPAGRFVMGSPPDEAQRRDDETQHWVTLTKGFWLGIHPVTQAQWQAAMGDNPSRFEGAALPVERILWRDALAFCRARQAGRPDLSAADRGGMGIRLPGRHDHRVPLRRRRHERPGQLRRQLHLRRRPARSVPREDDSSRQLRAQPLGPPRYARQRPGMVPGLVRRLFPCRRRNRSARWRKRRFPGAARRFLARLPGGLPIRRPPSARPGPPRRSRRLPGCAGHGLT